MNERRSLLIVDDHFSIRDPLSTFMRRFDFEMEAVRLCPQALQSARAGGQGAQRIEFLQQHAADVMRGTAAALLATLVPTVMLARRWWCDTSAA